MIKHFPKLILASRSPRRRELLAAAGYDFEVFPPSDDAESATCIDETPEELVVRLARQKAADVARRIAGEAADLWCGRPGCMSRRDACTTRLGCMNRWDACTTRLILGCDTVAECAGKILGKPTDREDAKAMLALLSGQKHRVYSGLCLWPLPDGEPAVRVAVTRLRMDPLAPELLDAYIAGGQWQGKAGAFGYQDGLDWVHVVEGSESNVVGLPMELLAEMLAAFAG
jgi:septum formation protein